MAWFTEYRFHFDGLGSLALAVLLVSRFASSTPQERVLDSASIHGIVRDLKANPVANVLVTLFPVDEEAFLTAHTDSQGKYQFVALHVGVYSVRAEVAGYVAASISSISVGSANIVNGSAIESHPVSKSFDIVLTPVTSGAPNASNSLNLATPAFFDPPRFTVSGVTDTGNAGGHGSNMVARTSHAIAKDMVSLEQSSSVSQPANSEKEAAAAQPLSEQALREQIKRAPNDFDANHRLGAMLTANARGPEAIPYLERAANIKPDDYENAYDLVLANAVAGNDVLARTETQALLARHDLTSRNAASLYHLLAEVYEKLGDNLAAVSNYQQAAELDASENNFFDWGAELLLHRAPEPARDVFTNGNRLFPSSRRMLLGLGAAWFAQDDLDQAVQEICDASALNPGDPVPYLFLGRIETSEAVPSDKIVETLHRFVTLHSDNAEANYYYALGLWKRRSETTSTQSIEALLNRAIDLNPDFGPAYLQRGILRAEREDAVQAIEDYKRAIQAELRIVKLGGRDDQSAASELQEAHYRLAQTYRRMGYPDKAKLEIESYEKIAKDSAQHADQERHDIRRFVYTLREQPPAH